MDFLMNLPNGPTEEALKDFWMRRLADHQQVSRNGYDAGILDLPPILQLRWFGTVFEPGTQPGPVVAQEPIAQGLQDNDALGFTYPDPEFVNYTFVTDPTANMILPTVAPKIEQAPVEATHNDVDAEGEPAAIPYPADLPKVETTKETYEAINYLTGLPVKQLTYAVAFLQQNLSVKQNNALIEQNSMMADQEMDIDQPEQMDGITNSDDALLNEANDTEIKKKPARPVRKEIYDIPPPDHSSRDSCDQYLVTCRQMGFTYKEIIAAGGLTDAEPTLRGRHRTLTKAPHQRVRKPKWTAHDVALLQMVTLRWFNNNGINPGDRRPHWLQIAQEMRNAGSSYHFGAGTVSRKWARLYPHLVATRP
ncbi:hypothetical protein CEP54_004701 [Fusarium duplospermum]|uniref:Myb-like domain-containing protein n=1 Tax=Fusarium duplospermum TaxID=1325734 RepID=A0A428QGQ7_9HYPO|nr:hypothetical protein CEP54_004701 [Fusarium duplospermum]